LTLGGIAGLILCACAAAPDRPAEEETTALASSCLQQTGTRIPQAPGTCVGLPGRTYSHEALELSGQTTVGGALRTLNPALTVSQP
jgi:hypothetical protein